MNTESLYERWLRSHDLTPIQVKRGEWRFDSVDSPEGWWTVYYNGRDYACTCPDFLEDYRDQTRWWRGNRVDKIFTDCKHILAVRTLRHDLDGLPLPKIYRTSKDNSNIPCNCSCGGKGGCSCTDCGGKCGDRPANKTKKEGNCEYNCFVEPYGGYEQRIPSYENKGITTLQLEPIIHGCAGQTVGLKVYRTGQSDGYTNFKIISDFSSFSRNQISRNQLLALSKSTNLNSLLGKDTTSIVQSSSWNELESSFTPYQRSVIVNVYIPPDTAHGVYTFVLTSTNAQVEGGIAFLTVQECPQGFPPFYYRSSPFCLDNLVYHPGATLANSLDMATIAKMSQSELREYQEFQRMGCFPDDYFPGRIGGHSKRCYVLNTEGKQELIGQLDLPVSPCDSIPDIECPRSAEPPECFPSKGGYNAIQRIITGRKIVDTDSCTAQCEVVCTRVQVPECPPPKDKPPDDNDTGQRCMRPADKCIPVAISNLSSVTHNDSVCPSGYRNAGFVLYGSPPTRGTYFCCLDVQPSNPYGDGCSQLYVCDNGNCRFLQANDVGKTTYTSLLACQSACGQRYRCQNGSCISDPTGIYRSLAECQNALLPAGFSGGQCTVQYQYEFKKRRIIRYGSGLEQIYSQGGSSGTVQGKVLYLYVHSYIDYFSDIYGYLILEIYLVTSSHWHWLTQFSARRDYNPYADTSPSRPTLYWYVPFQDGYWREEFYDFSITRVDNQPDNCGDPPPRCPQL